MGQARGRVGAAPVVFAIFALAIALAFATYAPLREAPFSVTDFSEFLPRLTGHATFGSRLSSFVHYYAGQGRFNVVLYGYLILEWTLFGRNPAAWQMSRFVEMCGIIAFAYALLRRLAGSRVGAAAGASLYFVATAAATAFIRPTIAEPIAMWPILGALLLATRYQRTPRWKTSGIAIAVLLVLVVLTKEVLVVFVPFAILLAVTFRPEGGFARPARSRRNAWLVGAAAIATALALVPVVVIARRAAAASYAGAYGHAGLSPGHVLELALALTLPGFQPYEPHRGFLVIANALFALVVAAGWLVALRPPTSRRERLTLGAVLASLLGAGVATYAPWPFFNFFYGLPYLMASGGLLAFAIAFIQREQPALRWPAYVACVVGVVQCGTFGAYFARTAVAQRRVNASVADLIARRPATDSIVVATRTVSALAWTGRGPSLRRYAVALHPGAQIPPVADAACGATSRSGTGPAPRAITVISYSDDCGPLAHPVWTARERFSYVNASTASVEQDSVRADAELWPTPR